MPRSAICRRRPGWRSTPGWRSSRSSWPSTCSGTDCPTSSIRSITDACAEPARETVMVPVIDMECSIPGTDASQPEPGHDQEPTAAQPAGYGMANYSRIFRSRREGSDPRPDISLDAYVDKLGKLGIVRSVPFGITNDEETTLLRRYPHRFIGLAPLSINAFKGKTGGR